MVYAALRSERNQRLLEQKAMEPAQIVRRVAYICNVRATPKS